MRKLLQESVRKTITRTSLCNVLGRHTRDEEIAEYFQTKYGIPTPRRALSATERSINTMLAIMDRFGFKYMDLSKELPMEYRYEAPQLPNQPHLRRVK